MESLELGNPNALYFLIVIPVILALFWLHSHRADKGAASAFRVSYSAKQYIALGVLWSLVFAGLAGALADPRSVSYGPSEDLPRGDFVFLVDTSLGMAARPSLEENSRIETARQVMTDVYRNMPARFLVFGYSGMAEPLSGFSDDETYLSEVINYGIYTEVFPIAGSELVHALGRVAHEKRENPRYENVTHIVLLSDGNLGSEYVGRFNKAIEEVRAAGLTVVAVGMGSGGPEKIPFFDQEGKFTGHYYAVLGSRNTDYVAYLEEDNMRRIADLTGGRYFHESQTVELIDYLMSTLSDAPIDIEHDRDTISSQSFAWIFVSLSFIAFAAIVAGSRKFYY